MRIIGHRGSGRNGTCGVPENTLASFRRAEREGASMIELDVHLSADGVAYVIHDDTLDRTTDGRGCVGRRTAAELDELTAQGHPLPRLEAVLTAVGIDLNVEIKVTETDGCPAADRVLAAEEVGRVLEGDPRRRYVLVSSFDVAQLLAVRAQAPRLPLGLLTTKARGFDVAREHGFDAVHPLASIVDAERLATARAAGLMVHPWTVNDAAQMRQLIHLGVDGIITDYPARLAEVSRRLTPPS